MNNFRIPPSAAWYTQAVCTPNDGLLYIAGNHSSIAYIPSHRIAGDDKTQVSENRIISSPSSIQSIVCDSDWSTTKWFVTLDELNVVAVWNLETGKVCRGHKAHLTSRNSNEASNGTMCITSTRQVLSIDRNSFIKYCLASNTFSRLSDNLVPKKKSVSLLKASPYDPDIVGVGHRDGLILIVNLKHSTLVHKLRAHDTEIVSLEWMLVTPKDAQPIDAEQSFVETPEVKKANNRPKKRAENPQKSKRREAPKAIMDEGDMFDMYSYDYLEDEFGAISKPAPVEAEPSPREQSDDESANVNVDDGERENTNNVNFDFVEACQSLREQIVRERDDRNIDEITGTSADPLSNAFDMSEIRKMKKKTVNDGSIDPSDSGNDEGEDETEANASTSVQSTIGSIRTADELEDIESQMNAMSVKEKSETNECIYLASGGRESFIVIWDTKTGNISDRIQLKQSHGKPEIPKTISVITWYKPNELLVNNPNGRISKWTILSDIECRIHKSIELKEDFIDRSVIGMCSNTDLALSTGALHHIVWTFSIHLHMIGRHFGADSNEIFANLHTLPIGMTAIRDSPHDPNRVAIAGNNKRITILDLLSLKPQNVQVQSLTSQIQSKILALAWHPINECLLSFATAEGRVGVFDIGKQSSTPEIAKNFCGSNIYSLSYGFSPLTQKHVLFACNQDKLMMFNENDMKNPGKLRSMNFQSNVSSVCASIDLVAVGLANGTLKIFSLDMKELWSETLSRKYLGEISWSSVNPSMLAVACDDGKIHLIEALKADDRFEFKRVGELVGHEQSVTCVKWSNQTEHLLVSTSNDTSVRVWNTKEMKTIAWHAYESRMFSAIFMPTDENFVMCSGFAETLHIFDIRENLVEKVGDCKVKNKKKKITHGGDIKWATAQQIDVAKVQQSERRKLKKIEQKVEQPTTSTGEEMREPQAQDKSLTEDPFKMNFTTILYLTNKEMNKDSLFYLEQLIANDETDSMTSSSMHSKLFSSQKDVHELLVEELENHKQSKTESIGNLLIPQIDHNLKENIMDCIQAKNLTPQHIALAPSISFEFWRNCCMAYAAQCVDEGCILKAIPYMLGLHQINEAIEKLSEAHYYREALAIAKMYKQPEETYVFNRIVSKWIEYLDSTGNFEAAALITFLSGDEESVADILRKRRNPTEQIEKMINDLDKKFQKNKENKIFN